MTEPRSGRQLRIVAGDYEADIASIGASLRALRFRWRDLVVPFEADEVRPGYRGAVLAPWPNRVVDGRYSFAGEEHQLPLTEPARGHALHGLVCWLDFAVREVADDAVVLAAVIVPQAGYPFHVEVQVEYRLDARGLHQRVTGRNLGADAAPWGTGPHPYLTTGDEHVDQTELELPASEVLTVTADRLSPIALEGVDAHPEWDFRTPRAIGDTFIDHAFTGLTRDAAGAAAVRLRGAKGDGVEMVWDAGCPWVQVHTADTPDADTSRRGLAVEPMTCPPDVFNSGTDLVVLQPGAEHAASWSIRGI
ncbi:aldose 1-epimerase family protein [Microbacterium sp.]|uniref:aldose 1-epimerase family protein n=1 Tax=Microbacterium sp. TaxID=51671 RepID=UPI003A944D5A